MFYCEACAKTCSWPYEYTRKSYGPCEMCGKPRLCADVPSSALPQVKPSSITRARKVKPA